MSVKQIIAYAFEGNHVKLSEALDKEMEERVAAVMKELYVEEAHSLFEMKDEDDDIEDDDDEDENEDDMEDGDEEDEDEELEEKAPKKMKYSKKK